MEGLHRGLAREGPSSVPLKGARPLLSLGRSEMSHKGEASKSMEGLHRGLAREGPSSGALKGAQQLSSLGRSEMSRTGGGE